MSDSTKAIELFISSELRWKIKRASPRVFDVKIGPGKLVNPLFYGLSRLHNLAYLQDEHHIVISTNTIIIELDDDGSETLVRLEKAGYAELDDQIAQFIKWVRWIAFLPAISPTAGMMGLIKLDVLPEAPVTLGIPVPTRKNAHVRADLVHHCITEEAVKKATRHMELGDAMPVHCHILLDAYAAFARKDYRLCLLYAAIAAESLAASSLDAEYAKRVAGGKGPALRLIDLPQAKGTSVRKDPVYEALASRTEFSALIHERPLYLLGSSLLIDQPETYRLARMLYSTRNRIVHRGELSEGDASKSFALSRSDAAKRLQCAADIFDWFNVKIIKPVEPLMIPATLINLGHQKDASVMQHLSSR